MIEFVIDFFLMLAEILSAIAFAGSLMSFILVSSLVFTRRGIRLLAWLFGHGSDEFEDEYEA